MPVPSIDQYFGLGKGDAQIYNANNALNAYFKMEAQQRLQEQQDQKSVADMLAKIQPDKLRAVDIPEFNQKYGALKKLYATNKDLYRNPLRNLEAYTEAQKLTSELQQLNADSQAVEKWTGEAGHAYLKNPDELEDYTVSLLGEVKNTPVSQIRTKLGGRLPDLQDVQFVGQPIDWTKIGKSAYAYGESMGGVKEVPVTIKPDGKNGIPIDKELFRIDQVLDPTVAGSFTEGLFLSDKNFKKQLSNTFKRMTPEQVEAYNQDFAQRYPSVGFKVEDPLTYAKAEMLKRNGALRGDTKSQNNADYDREIKKKDKAEEQTFQIKKMYLQNQLTRGNMLYASQLRNQEKSDKNKDDSLLLQQGKDMVAALNNPNITNQELAKSFSKVIKVGQNVAGEPVWHRSSKDGKQIPFNAYWTATEAKNQKVLEQKYAISKQQAEDIYKKGAKIAYIPVWAPDKKDPNRMTTYYITINPLSYSANEDAYSALKLLGGTEKQGLKAK